MYQNLGPILQICRDLYGSFDDDINLMMSGNMVLNSFMQTDEMLSQLDGGDGESAIFPFGLQCLWPLLIYGDEPIKKRTKALETISTTLGLALTIYYCTFKRIYHSTTVLTDQSKLKMFRYGPGRCVIHILKNITLNMTLIFKEAPGALLPREKRQTLLKP